MREGKSLLEGKPLRGTGGILLFVTKDWSGVLMGWSRVFASPFFRLGYISQKYVKGASNAHNRASFIPASYIEGTAERARARGRDLKQYAVKI